MQMIYTQLYGFNSELLIILIRSHIFRGYRLIGIVGRMFANGSEDLGPIPGRVIPKTFKIVLDTSYRLVSIILNQKAKNS